MQKLFDEMICPQCEKMFICWDRATWKYKKVIKGYTRFFCKWSCLEKYKANEAEERAQKRKARGKRKTKTEEDPEERET